jgi:hypothetical protein
VNHTTSIVTIMLAFSLFFVVLTNPYSYAQQIPSVSSTHPKTHAVRITSPNRGQQVPIGKDLSVSGISSIGIGNTTTKTTPSTCQAYVIVNGVKPYQQAKGTGPGGAADYSKWNFVLTSKYTTIKPGPANKITAKYICSNNPASASFYSVNVTGVGAHAKPALIASTHTPTNASPHAQVLSSAPPHTHSLSPTATALKQKEQQPVVVGNSDRSTTLNTPINPAAPKTSVNYAPKSVVTPTSSSNIAGFNSSAIIAGLNIPTSGTAAAISYEQPVVPATTTSSNSNTGGPASATSSVLSGLEPNGPASNIGSTTDHSRHGYDSSSSSVSKDKSTTQVSHHTHKSDHQDTGSYKTARIHSSSVSHHQDTGSYKTARIHSSSVSYKHSSNVSYEDKGIHKTPRIHSSSSGGIHTLHDKVSELKNSIMGDVKKELESDGVHVSLP